MLQAIETARDRFVMVTAPKSADDDSRAADPSQQARDQPYAHKKKKCTGRVGLLGRSSRRFLKRGAERMRRIDAEDLHLLGEERQLLEREHELAVLRMALDVGIELRREEIAFDHVAFELGHVDAIGGEATEHLVERRRHV